MSRSEKKDKTISKTKGQTEAEITEAIIKFEKEYMGRGPLETKTYIIENLVLIWLKGALIQVEHQLVKSGGTKHGRRLIKQMRVMLLNEARPSLEAVMKSITGRNVKSLHTDISTLTGERIIVFSLDGPPEFERKKRLEG